MTKIARMAALIAFGAGIHGTAAQAQSVAGRWDGASTTQQGRSGLTITLDSAAAGWKGSWNSEGYGGGPLAGISMKADTVWFSISIQNTSVDMQGTLSADKKTMTGYIWVANADAGTFSLKRYEAPKPPPQHQR